MCPLRLILLFLSATLAGFFVLKNLKSKPDEITTTSSSTDELIQDSSNSSSSLPLFTKITSAIGSGFWVCVDMASGKYLWRNLTSGGATAAKQS
ncbi:hypothetical protein AQUCO_00400495v1 [Aquilegia coerulea]|uniref:Uncharacterized protein n=1 Tax=Aquilegia coerulea TaxID=218851 RepID=A0A2G5EV70_AQUCA|nr:hypothetical protein AQUCO_00400495v1 [Aquilegia coerulea]